MHKGNIFRFTEVINQYNLIVLKIDDNEGYNIRPSTSLIMSVILFWQSWR